MAWWPGIIDDGDVAVEANPGIGGREGAREGAPTLDPAMEATKVQLQAAAVPSVGVGSGRQGSRTGTLAAGLLGMGRGGVWEMGVGGSDAGVVAGGGGEAMGGGLQGFGPDGVSLALKVSGMWRGGGGGGGGRRRQSGGRRRRWRGHGSGPRVRPAS